MSFAERFSNLWKKEDDAANVLNPADVPLKWGKKYEPEPKPHQEMSFNTIQWYWFPGFQLDINFLLSAGALFFTTLGPIIYVRTGSIATFVTFYIIAFILGYIRVNIAMNQTIRTAICRCNAKKEVALALWESSKPEDVIHSKDVFHTEKSFFYHLVVLRDGTVEIWNGNEDKIQQENGKVEFGQVEVSAEQVRKAADV
ncbi:hypothetical protein FGB62_96g14 [Gracilaria domingensis]|nr:hypothetical protein FGB62_96g14 [Gracilaria domingensis]